MNKNLEKAFKNAKYDSDTDLAGYVWQKIVIRNKWITFIKLSVFSSFGILSLAGLIPAFKTLLSEFSRSGFYEYLSLLFSSNRQIASYWKELTFSITESLPMINIIYTFILIFILFLSLKYVAKQIIKNQLLLSQFQP